MILKDGQTVEFWVLDKENVDFMMRLTGKTEKQLREMYETSIIFDHVQVFWQIRDRWYNMRVAGQYVRFGMLDDAVRKAIEGIIDETIEAIPDGQQNRVRRSL